MKFNRWTVLEPLRGVDYRVLCQCDCGTVRRVWTASLRNGGSQSCGCLSVEVATKRLTKHGAYGSPEYISYRSMLDRCTNRNNRKFPRYGGRGIVVCPQWFEFEVFLADMGARPSGTTLGRIDNDGNYEPANCRWESATQQGRNRSNTILVTFNGETRSASDWDEFLGLRLGTVSDRIERGWDAERALLQKPRVRSPNGIQAWRNR